MLISISLRYQVRSRRFGFLCTTEQKEASKTVFVRTSLLVVIYNLLTLFRSCVSAKHGFVA